MVLGICSIQDATRNTPPQIDISTYRDKRRGETRTSGEREWRPFAPVFSYRLLYLSATKKTLQLLAQVLVASYRPISSIRDSHLHYHLDTMYGSSDVRRARRQSVLKILDGSLSEEDHKEDGKQPKPGTQRPEKPKPERKGDKGSRRVKRPKVQGLVSFYLQKSSGLVCC
jgi:hypothetical protein